VRTFPGPEPLATPTDLSREDVRKVTEAVNPILADAFALYVKTKNFHWHLSGARFRDIHLLWTSRPRRSSPPPTRWPSGYARIGGTTVRSVPHVNALQTIGDDNVEVVDPDDMQRRAHEVCDRNGDYATASLLDDLMDGTERRTWFLFEYLNDTDRFD
jgi:starvation-inducible DNA-binding protein